MRPRRRHTQRPPAPSRPEAGFTLIETIISLAIMLVAALGVASLFLHSINLNTGASERAMASAVAQQRIERLRSVSFDALADEDTVVISGGRQYAVEVNVTVLDTDDDDGKDTLKLIEVEVMPLLANGAGVWAEGAVTIWTERAALGLGTNR
jgi:prepilin-type N-terminal cleavage/methylation domain-containing protein